MIKFIFYTFVFYVVMKILRMFLDPIFDKKESNVATEPKRDKIHTTPQKPIVGEYIEYEEVK